MLSTVKSQGIEKVDRQLGLTNRKYFMWVDGVLDDARVSQLKSEPGIVSFAQYAEYGLADFSRLPSRFKNSEQDRFRYLDPHRFVVSTSEDHQNLEINFNPTPEQIQKLRDFQSKLRLLK